MNKELEESIDGNLIESIEQFIEQYKELRRNKDIIANIDKDFFFNLTDTILNCIENSIPKETLIEKIRERQFELQQEYIDFKDDIKLNTLKDLLDEIERKSTK